ncbi:uncharacterized protein [Nicotiana tomentosiformis]|uniref:uncharacterized protein n=1 Tax=Nicotiana tomentosiformis TaxID=4098 RepID=UPI00388C9237
MIPEDQIQTYSKEGSFQVIVGKKKGRKKEERTKTKILHLLKEDTHADLNSVSMISVIFWNIRGVNTKKALPRLKTLIAIYNVELVAILEPFASINQIKRCRRFLGYQHCVSNTNCQIWIMWSGNNMATILNNHEQQLTIKLDYGAANSDLYITAVYSKCPPEERRDMWSSLELTNLQVKVPWCIGGDFNVILDPDEKKGSRPYRMSKSLEFSTCMDNCGMMDLDFVGPKYTWCNNWEPRRRIWKRLDRVFINDQLSQVVEEVWKNQVDGDDILRLKARVNWFKEGNANTNYFHSTIRDRRRRLQILKIKDHRGHWIEGDSNIGKAVVHHFQQFFNINHHFNYHNIINCISQCVNDDDNENFTAIPDTEEIRDVVFNMSLTSAAGSDGYNRKFFQTCWDIIKEDIIVFVQDVFNDRRLTKFFSHTCLVLIPKVDSPSSFSDLKPISLTQEIAQGVNKKNRGGNVIIKLDMAKAYDRMSWTFLMAVMRKFGFSKNWIDLI